MEHEHGMEPEVKKFFQKIISMISYGLLWMALTTTAGIYFRLAWDNERYPLIAIILFYACATAGLFLLLRHYYRIWKK